jgi:hypothetical protein
VTATKPLETWRITLLITYDPDAVPPQDDPSEWDYDELLDLRGDETVAIETAEFIEYVEREEE